MRIAIINRHVQDFLGGSEMQCHNIAEELTLRGHEVIYIAPQAKSESYSLTYQVVPVASQAKQIIQAIKISSPDIIYWRFNKYRLLLVAKESFKLNIPFVFAVSHIDDTRRFNFLSNPSIGLKSFMKTIKESSLNRINYFGFRYVSAVTVLNPKFLGMIPVKRQAYVPNSVVIGGDYETDSMPYVIWVANIKRAKRPEVFIRMAKALEDLPIKFVMVGEILSAEYDWISSTRRPNFEFLGKKSIREVNGLIKNSLFLVHTCMPEGFGNNFIQAWLNGKPTISLEFDPGDFIVENDLGYVADNNEAEFIKSVRYFVNNPESIKIKGNNALEFAKQNFAVSTTVDRLLEVLEQTVEGNKGTRGAAS